VNWAKEQLQARTRRRSVREGAGETVTRIVYVSHTADLYGAERSLFTLVDEQQRGSRFSVLVVVPGTGPLVDLLTARGIEVRVQRFGFWLSWQRRRGDRLLILATMFDYLVSAFRLSRALREPRVHLVCTNTLASPFGAFLALFLRCPHVWHIREIVGPLSSIRLRLGRVSTLWLLRTLSDTILFNSEATAAHYREDLGATRSRVVYNGFDFSQDREPEPAAAAYGRKVSAEPEPVVLFVGKASAMKNYEFALEVLRVLLDRGNRVRFCFVGGAMPDYADHLADSCRRLDVVANAEFLDFTTDIDSLYHRAALIAVCARNEPFGRSAVEALALGIPAVVVGSGGVQEIVRDGFNGRVVPPDDATAFAEAIASLLGDAPLYQRLAKNARGDMQARFSKDRYRQEIEAEFRRLL
jgi:glycosyltransferase involved in cell wall biosynthesis